MNKRHFPIVTLLTDFGTADGYVAAMKGVIASLAPDAAIHDATHEIPPQDIAAGAWALGSYWRWYPKGTIHVAVVDPGVGTERQALLVTADEHLFLAPDNGLLSVVLRQASDVQLRRLRASVSHPQGRSATFHGRDVFAYAAGLLARGETPNSISEPSDNVVMSPWSVVRKEADRLVGEVVHVDRFGNLITNITRRQLDERQWREVFVTCAGLSDIPLVETYGCAGAGSVVALFGSMDTLEIAEVGGSAARRLGAGRGTRAQIVRKHSTTL